jgi:ElaB/YqjD/DUF883 family membrane-anchored ribosome-binding protein
MAQETLNGNRKIDEALQLLNEAARDKKDELQRLLGEKYSNIKEALTEVAMNNKEVLSHIQRVAQEKLEEGQEKISAVVSDVDEQVRSNPWPYIGGAALAALLIGYVLGSSKR